MKPRITYCSSLFGWVCRDPRTLITGYGATPSEAYRHWYFGKRSIHGTARS